MEDEEEGIEATWLDPNERSVGLKSYDCEDGLSNSLKAEKPVRPTTV